MKVELEVDEGVLVFDSAKTIAIWNWHDAPEAYRYFVPNPLDRTLLALVPKGYKRDIKHITQNPYFAENFLDVYNLPDGATLYVGS